MKTATLVASVLVAAALVTMVTAKPAGLGRCYGSVHRSTCVAFKKDQCDVVGYESFYHSQDNSCKYYNGRDGTPLGAIVVSKSGADSWASTAESPREFTDSCEFMHTGSCYNAQTGESKCIADKSQCLDNEVFRDWTFKETVNGISDYVCRGGCKQAPGKPFTQYGYCLEGTTPTCALFPTDCKTGETFKKPGEQYDVTTTSRSGKQTTTKHDVDCPCHKVHTGGCKKNKVCSQSDWRCGVRDGYGWKWDAAGEACTDNGAAWATLDPKPDSRYTNPNCPGQCAGKWTCNVTADPTQDHGVGSGKADQSIRCAAHSDQCNTEESWLEPRHAEMQLPTNPDSVCTLCEVPKNMNVNGMNFNKQFGRFAAVPGGYYNEALHENSLAFGGTHKAACTTTSHNQFKICSSSAMIAGVDIKAAGSDIDALKADAKKNKDDIAKLTTSLEAANSDIIGLKKLVKDTQDNNDTNQTGWMAALIVAIVAFLASAAAGTIALVRKPTLGAPAPAGKALDGEVGVVSVQMSAGNA